MTYKDINTPRGDIIIVDTPAGQLKAELVWNAKKFSGPGRGSGGAQDWRGRFSAAQWFVDNEVLALCEPYIPLKTSMLIKSGILATELGSGLVQWIAPYAAAQYYMVRKNPSQTGPLRGPYWFERMKETHGKAIAEGAKKIAGGGR